MKDKTKILPWGRTLNLVLMVNVFSSLCAILDAWLLRGWEELFLPCTGKAEKLVLAFPSFCEDEHLGWAARHSSCVRVWIKRAVPAGVEKEASAMWNLCSYLYTGGIVKRILVTPRTGLHSLFSYPTCVPFHVVSGRAQTLYRQINSSMKEGGSASFQHRSKRFKGHCLLSPVK